MGENRAAGMHPPFRINGVLLMESQFAIGNRAELLVTPGGCVLWDLVPLLDQDTVDKVPPRRHETLSPNNQ